jgi:hypothetical protein
MPETDANPCHLQRFLLEGSYWTRAAVTHTCLPIMVYYQRDAVTVPGLYPRADLPSHAAEAPKKSRWKKKRNKRFQNRFPKVKINVFWFKVPEMPLNALPHALRRSLKCSPSGT